MSDNTSMYFTTGEFAKLCHTTKHTLFHYDEIGILVPELIKENGYRYYNANQIMIFDLITVLKDIGASLKEIKVYLEDHTPEQFIKILEEKKQEINEKKKRLEQMEALLENAIHLTQMGISVEGDRPYLEEQELEYYIRTPIILEGDTLTDKDFIVAMREHIKYCEAHEINEQFPLGYAVKMEDFKNENYMESHCLTKINEAVNLSRLHIKPKGTYAVMIHRGPYEEVPHSLQKLKAYIDMQGLQIVGDAYEYELVSYLATKDVSQYVIKLEVRVF